MNEDKQQQDFGGISARTLILERRVEAMEDKLHTSLDLLSRKLDGIQSTIDKSTGAWRAVAYTIGILGGVAGLLTTLYHIGILK